LLKKHCCSLVPLLLLAFTAVSAVACQEFYGWRVEVEVAVSSFLKASVAVFYKPIDKSGSPYPWDRFKSQIYPGAASKLKSDMKDLVDYLIQGESALQYYGLDERAKAVRLTCTIDLRKTSSIAEAGYMVKLTLRDYLKESRGWIDVLTVKVSGYSIEDAQPSSTRAYMRESEVRWENPSYSDAPESYTVELRGNTPPRAYIDSISPSPAKEDSIISLTGHGEDEDGRIVAYEWRSSIEGFLSSQRSFQTRLSPGTHTIYFRVRDDSGAWSEYTAATLVVSRNQPPTSAISASRSTAAVGEEVELDASESSDPDGRIVAYEFDYGDGAAETLTTPKTSHSYSSPGEYTVKVRVKDDSGAYSSWSTLTIKVEEPSTEPSREPTREATPRAEEAYIIVVVEDEQGAPVKGAEVYVDGAYAGSTDSSGTLHVKNLATGTHSIRIASKGHAEKQLSVHMRKGENKLHIRLSPARSTQIKPIYVLVPIGGAAALIAVLALLQRKAPRELEQPPAPTPKPSQAPRADTQLYDEGEE